MGYAREQYGLVGYASRLESGLIIWLVKKSRKGQGIGVDRVG